MKKMIKAIVVCFLLIAAVAGVMAGSKGIWGTSDQPQYRTEPITRGSIAEVVTATGTLNPMQLVTVGTQVSGQINQIYIKVNDEVKKGQLLAEIDPSLLITQLQQSKSNLETARINYEQAERDMERNRMLLAKDYVAKMDLEHAEQAYASSKNSYEASKIQVEHDQVNLNYTKILAPIDGIVISQNVTPGQTVVASFQTPNLFTIAGDLTQMKIEVDLSEADIGKVKVGQAVTFTVDAFPDEEFTGEVQSITISPISTQGVVSYTVIVTAANEDKKLLPGMTAYTNITLSEKEDVLRAPAAALRFAPPVKRSVGINQILQPGAKRAAATGNAYDPNIRYIYLLRGAELVKTPVTIGVTDETNVEVSGGIAEGELVVTGIMPQGK